MINELHRFFFSVIRVVPDPIKDEAVNIGVVVASEEGRAAMKVRVPRSRIRDMQRSFSFETLNRSIIELGRVLGVEAQLAFGENVTGYLPQARMDVLADSLSNQLQLTRRNEHLGSSLDSALAALFFRFVAKRMPAATYSSPLTHAALNQRIRAALKQWNAPHMRIQPGGLLRGKSASHPVDTQILNGHPRAGIYALATHPDDRQLSYLYRDSLPTIAQDMGPEFKVYAVLPPETERTDPKETEFAAETEQLLVEQGRIPTVTLDKIDTIRPEIVKLLL